MPNREEIREGMWRLLIKWEALPKEKQVRHHLVDDMLRFQSGKGVVLKVNERPLFDTDGNELNVQYINKVAVEPLIKE